MAAVDGWNPSLIASMAMVSRHMRSRAHSYLWPAFCNFYSKDAIRELTEEGESQRETPEGKGGGEVREGENERENDREGEGEIEKKEPLGGWIALARLLVLCPASLTFGSRHLKRWTLDMESGSCLSCLTRVKEGEGLLFSSHDVVFQTYNCLHQQDLPPFLETVWLSVFQGIVKDFHGSSSQKMVYDHVRRTELDDDWSDEDILSEKKNSHTSCPFCFSPVSNVVKMIRRKKIPLYMDMYETEERDGDFAFVCHNGHFLIGIECETDNLKDENGSLSAEHY